MEYFVKIKPETTVVLFDSLNQNVLNLKFEFISIERDLPLLLSF